LIGKLVSAGGGSIVFKTPFAGKINVAAANVERITTEKPVTLKMADGSIYKERQIVSTDEGTAAYAAGEAPGLFQPGEIAYVNPEAWLLGEGYKWYGQVNVSLQSERGNTDTDELDTDFESIWRSLEDRYTTRGTWEIDETNGDKNKDTWTLRGKYDRFTVNDPDNYYGMQVAFKRDEFADLDLRTTIGPYIGRQFYESSLLALQGEIGLVYVDEQFEVAEDDDFVGGSWELRLTSDIIPKIDLYINQEGVMKLDEIDGVLVNTTIGFGLPTVFGIKSSAEALIEYDGGAVDGVDDTDQTYRIKFGYVW